MLSSPPARLNPPSGRPASTSSIAARLLRARAAARSEHLSLSVHPGQDQERPILLTTVPKRVLARAVDRNQLKRVVRECWRRAPEDLRSRPVLIRLWRRPPAFPEWTSAERRRQWRSEVSALILSAGQGLRLPLGSRKRQD